MNTTYDLSELTIGSRWLIRGIVRECREVVEYHPQRGNGPWALMVPNRSAEEAKGLKLKNGYHWTDWMLARTPLQIGRKLEEGETPEEPGRKRGTAAERAAEAAREEVAVEAEAASKRAPLTPIRRARNKINSARHKLKHPEKHGRSEWSPLEVADINNTITEAEAEVESLKEA